jgi:hypothetical protein
MLLAIWMHDHGHTPHSFAALLGACSDRSIYRYLSGERIPGRVVMLRISIVTEGKVRPDDFFDLQAPPPLNSRVTPPAEATA